MLTLSLGIALTRAALDWGESALATLSPSETAANSGAQLTEKLKA
jgi:hypothetical protein